jgi:hypothetical protein
MTAGPTFLSPLRESLVDGAVTYRSRRRRRDGAIGASLMALALLGVGVVALDRSNEDGTVPIEGPTTTQAEPTSTTVNLPTVGLVASQLDPGPLTNRVTAAVVATDSQIVVAGGRDPAYDPLTDAAVFTPATGEWEPLDVPEGFVSGFALGVGEDERVLVLSEAGLVSWTAGTGEWTRLPDPPSPIFDANSTGQSRVFETDAGGLLMMGTDDGTQVAWFDTATDQWAFAPLPDGTAYSSTFGVDGAPVLVSQGEDPEAPATTVHTWDGAAWTSTVVGEGWFSPEITAAGDVLLMSNGDVFADGVATPEPGVAFHPADGSVTPLPAIEGFTYECDEGTVVVGRELFIERCGVRSVVDLDALTVSTLTTEDQPEADWMPFQVTIDGAIYSWGATDCSYACEPPGPLGFWRYDPI